MKKNILIIGLIIQISLILAVTNPTSLVEFTYDFNKTVEIDNTMHYTDSVLLTINTPIETTCYYTTVEGTTPSNPFERNYGTKHELVLEDLPSQLHKYYIRCGNNVTMEASFKTKETVSAQIDLSKNSPLKAGTYDITLTTSSFIIGEPDLEYSIDGIVYKPIPLEGSGKNWKGHLIIEEDSEETVGSFKFKATDLDGKEGTTITGDKVFIIDTKVPRTIQTFDAIGYKGEIELSWKLDEEDIDEYRIYRSDQPGVDYTDLLETTDEEEYTDTEVTNGKTYYYRVSAIDKAGNIGQYSREISATALISNTTSSSNVLSQQLVGRVDNLLTEINQLKNDIETIKQSIEIKDEDQKQIFTDLDLSKEYTNALSEIASLKKDVERYKTQNLQETELDQKINSARVKIDIIKKKIPETITIEERKEIKRDFSEEKLTELIFEYMGDSYTEKETSKTISQTQNIIKENEPSIKSEIRNIEITYIDGTKKQMSIIKDTITGESEDEDTRIGILIPKEIADTASEIVFQNRDYEVIKEDPVISFDSNTKEIIYTLNKQISTGKIEDIIISPIKIYKEQEDTNSLITGNAIFSSENLTYTNIGYIALGIVILLLFAYLLYIKRTKKSEELLEVIELIKETEEHKKRKRDEELKKTYSEIQQKYKHLTEKEKKKIYPKIKRIHGK